MLVPTIYRSHRLFPEERLCFESAEDKGTTFFIELPLVSAESKSKKCS
jgi:hypothetical protein